MCVGFVADRRRWGDPAPDRAEYTLQQHISALRKALGAEHLSTRSPAIAGRRPARHRCARTWNGRWARRCVRWRLGRRVGGVAIRPRVGGRALADVRGEHCSEPPRFDSTSSAHRRRDVLRRRLECGQARELAPELEQLVSYPLRKRLRVSLMSLCIAGTPGRCSGRIKKRAARRSRSSASNPVGTARPRTGNPATQPGARERRCARRRVRERGLPDLSRRCPPRHRPRDASGRPGFPSDRRHDLDRS